MKNGYNYDALNNTLNISASFAKKASKVGSPEYNLIVRLRRDCSNLTIQQEEKREGKKGLTYKKMKKFLSLNRDSDKLLKQFDKVCALSKVQPMPYKYVKDWFENRFPNYSEYVLDDEDYAVEPNKEEKPSGVTTEVNADADKRAA